MKLKRTNKLLALLLAVLMVIGLLPTMALADGESVTVYFAADNPSATSKTSSTLNDIMPIRKVTCSYFSIAALAKAAGKTPSFTETNGVITAAHVALQAVRDEFGDQTINPFDDQYSQYIVMNDNGKITSLNGKPLSQETQLTTSTFFTGTVYLSVSNKECAPAAEYNPFNCTVENGELVLATEYAVNTGKRTVYQYVDYYSQYELNSAQESTALEFSTMSSSKASSQSKNSTYSHLVYWLDPAKGNYENVTGSTEFYIAPTEAVGSTSNVASINFTYSFKKSGQYAIHTYNTKDSTYEYPGGWCIVNIELDTIPRIDTTKLEAAINATVQESTYYTARSWADYTGAKTAAQTYLDSLFDKDGKPTAANNADYQTTADAYAAALSKAFEALDALAEPSDLKNAQFAYQQLTTLTRRVFQPTGLNQSAYTEDSWNKFQQAAEQAATFLSTHSEPTGTPGKSETQACTDAYTAFWKAGFETLAAKESGTATISIVDSYALRKGEAPAYKGVYSVDVPAGGITLGDALTASLGAGYTLPWNDAGRGIGVYLNGVYIYWTITSVENRPDSSYNAYSGVRLKGGDEVLVALMQIPTGSNLSGSVTLAPYSDVHSAIRTISFVLDKEIVREASATAGTPVNLKAQYLCSSLMDYNGLTAPLAGAKVYVSEAFSTKAAAMEAAPDKDSGLVTGSDGVFSLALSSATGSAEGWYAVTVLAQGENSGLSNGANLIVHVTDPDDLSGVKAALKAELEKVYTAYEDDFYSAAQLTQLAALYNNGISGIDAAANSGDAEAAYKAANDGIRAIQRANEIESATNFTAVRLFLTRLPSAEDLQAGKLYNVDKPVLDLLFGTEGYYTRMTEKQRSELSGAESAMLTALRKAYEDSNSGADLPALPAFTVTYEVRNADNGEPVNLPLQNNSIGWNFYTFGGFNEDNGSIHYRWHYEGDGASAFDDTSRTFTLPVTGAYMTTLNPRVNCGDYSVWDYASDYYATNIPEHYQMESFDTFWIPRQNVTITYYVHAVDTLAGARSTALNTLKTTYQGYKRSDYTAENWATLYQAYQDGVAAINAATTEDAIQTALTNARNAMADVQQKQKDTNAVPGWGDGSDFNAGTIVGYVTVTAKNNTFPGGAFTSTIFSKTNYAIGENDNMMTVILRALHDERFTWEGTGGSSSDAFDISYLAKIKRDSQELGEFSGDPGSGWMGTLNDFMVNEGLNQFSVASGRLGDGDEIALVYTQNLGVDLGGSWGNSDTTLETLTVSSGRLIPSFESGEAGKTYDFALMISGSSDSIVVTPHAANINYMVKTFLNEKVTTDVVGNSYYRRKEAIPVRPGDVIWVGCGERAWPSMNKYGAEARAYSGTWYALHVISEDSGADYVNELIGKLPAVKESNYKDVDAQIKAIEAVIAQLNSGEKARVNTTALNAAKEKIKFYQQIDDVKAKLAALPKEAGMSDEQVKAAKAQIEAAYAAYTALTEVQQGYITVGDAKNYNALVDRLSKLAPETSAQTIVGSDKKPEKDGNEVTPAQVAVAPEVAADGTAKAEVKAEDVSKALEEAPDAKTLTVKVDTEGAASVEADLPADAVRAAADAGVGLNVETEQGTVKLSAADVKAAGGKDLAVSVKSNADGTTSFEVSAGGTAVAANVKVELPAKDGQVLVIVNADGTEEVVKKCVTSDGKVYAEIPAGAKVKVADAQGMTFGDVKETDWFAGAVEFVTSRGIFQGTGDGFQPNAPMNRAMLVTVLQRIAGEKARGENTFGDVEPEAWYADAVIWASENGIVNGTDAGFEPDEPVTREQIATMLYRFMKYLGYDVSASKALDGFPDGGDTADWAKEAMQWAASVGLFKGDANGNLNPGGEATRAEVATLVERLIGLMVK